jgi:acetylornithine deacetylase/succinyl-diaminopimelate desuccinylase-like protein
MNAPVALKNKINGLIAPDLLRVMLLEMGNIPSPAGGEGDLLEYLEKRFTSLGLKVDREVGAGALQAVLSGDGSGPTLALNAGLSSDVDFDARGAPRKSGLYDGEWIHGSGVSDMKSAFAVYFGAMKAIQQAGLQLRGNVVMRAMTETSSASPAADAVVIAAPTGLAISRSRAIGPGHPLSKAFAEAHRTVFFGRDPAMIEGEIAAKHEPLLGTGATALAYGPGGLDREGQAMDRDPELGEIVSVPNLVMSTKVFALAVADICGLERSQWSTMAGNLY